LDPEKHLMGTVNRIDVMSSLVGNGGVGA